MEIAVIHVRHLSELATWQFRGPTEIGGCNGPKTMLGCVKTQHPVRREVIWRDSFDLFGSVYKKSTSIGIKASASEPCCGFLAAAFMVVYISLHLALRTQAAFGETGRYTSSAPSNSQRKWFT